MSKARDVWNYGSMYYYGSMYFVRMTCAQWRAKFGNFFFETKNAVAQCKFWKQIKAHHPLINILNCIFFFRGRKVTPFVTYQKLKKHQRSQQLKRAKFKTIWAKRRTNTGYWLKGASLAGVVDVFAIHPSSGELFVHRISEKIRDFWL